METRKHTDVIRAWLPLAGLRVLDIGCGDGALTRFMAREGARATGIEPSIAQLEAARRAEAVAGADYVEGDAAALPFPAGSADAVVYMNALHHVPVDRMDRAVAEAARVLKPGGRLLVIEPLAEGPYFGIMRRVEDETEVRAAAYAALGRAAARGLEAVREEVYATPIKFRDFAAFEARMIAVGPARRPMVERHREELAREFLARGRREPDGIAFDQPCRANLLVRS